MFPVTYEPNFDILFRRNVPGVRLGDKVSGRGCQGACREGELIGGGPPVVGCL
jgi:hypothetical protein